MIRRRYNEYVPIIAWLAVIALAAGCSSKESKKAATDETGETGGDKATDDEPPPVAPAPVVKLERKQVQALLDRWLDAQNQGDFETYKTLYAQRFDGVRRSGAKVVRLNRDGWYVDRGRMFKHKMEVSISDVVISPFSRSAMVQFTQRYAARSYEDVGPKQLVVVREGDALRISREEMLQSTIVSSADQPDLASSSFAFVVEEKFLVLDTGGHGDGTRATLVDDGETVVTTAPVKVEDLPGEIARWQGRKVRSGGCLATVKRFVDVSLVVPHFGERQEWNGGIDGDQTPYTDKQIAASAFEMGATYLAGELAFDDPKCAAGEFARHDAEPEAATGETVSVSDALRAAATKAFRRLPAYKSVQSDFTADVAKPRPKYWDQYEAENPDDSLTIEVYRHPKSGDVLVSVMARAGAGCGSFEGGLWAVFRAKGYDPNAAKSPRLVLTQAHEGGVNDIADTVDIDGDGALEFIIKDMFGLDRALISADGDELDRVSVSFLDCAC